MPHPAAGVDPYALLVLALKEQAANSLPGRVPSGAAMNAYLANQPLTNEQQREQGIIDAADARYAAMQEADRARAAQLEDLRAGATARQFQTRRNVRELPTTASTSSNATVPFTEDNFPAVSSHSPMTPRAIRRVAPTTSASTSPQPRAIRRFTDVGAPVTDPEAAMTLVEKARLDPRVLAANPFSAMATGTGPSTSNMGTAPPQGEAALRGLDDKTANTVKMVANYQVQLPSGTALRTPYWQEILNRAGLYDPTFDQTQYGARQKLRSDFTSGQGARNIRSLNTAVGHLETLRSKADALNNFSIPIANRVINAAESSLGDPRMVEFNNAATAVENELATVFKGTGATDQEVKQWRESLNASQSPAQFTGAINTAIELLGSRLDALKSQWETGMGKPSDFEILTPKSRAIIQKLSGQSMGGNAEKAPTRIGRFEVMEQ